MMSNIYEYDDFRLFLRDRFREKCEMDSSFSHRRFAREAGFSNPGFLNDVIKGRRKLSRQAVEKMISGFSLSLSEAEFFKLLVNYRQTPDEEKKQKFYSQIVFRRNRSSFSRLNPALSRYYQDYRYPLLRTALMALDFRGDYEELGRFVRPQISASMVKKYIRDLCEWGLLEQGSDGKYRVTSDFIEPPETLSDLVKHINREWIIHALDALMKLSSGKRHVSSALFAVSRETSEAIGKRIESFREEIWKMVEEDKGKADRVIQMNIQLFPRSRERDTV